MRSSLAFCLVLVGSIPVSSKEPAFSENDVRFFENRIRPLLVEQCLRCHGTEKKRGGLRLDSREGILVGGYTSSAIDLRAPEKSLLLKAVRHVDDELKMPPKKKLDDRRIADLEKWIRMGAPYPLARVVKPETPGTTYWAFVPPVDPELPTVKDRTWATSPMDLFVLGELEKRGLRPAQPADKATLLRRVTFDLTGLPPTLEEIEAFLSDNSPDAYEKVVERLLASPAYGERWGRHWLDVARYADSNGLDENLAYGTAWRYRDYVVEAFNKDKPYSAFVREQLAGDRLPADELGTRFEQQTATGFLSLGPKVLAEVDETKMEMDIIDEQLDTLGRAFLGLTIGCARCHDHKFDPLSQEDYYALAGIFKSTKTMDHFTKIARWHEHELVGDEEREARKAIHERQVKALADAVAKLEKEKAAADVLKKKKADLAKLKKDGPTFPTALGVADRKVVDLRVHLRGSHLTLGKVVTRRFPSVLGGERLSPMDKNASGRLRLADWLVEPNHPLTARVMVNRIWRWHFGRGLVASTDNFGKLGSKPSHPELLDWLSRRFVESGWSMKALHRTILLSSTYRMGSAFDARSAKVDPRNVYLWRYPVRRLEAEPIRDSILAVSGSLDRTIGGPALSHVKNREFLFDHTSQDGTTYGSKRRSIYLPVVRNHLFDMFQLFDFPDALVMTGNRATTTVAPQALFLLNSDFVLEACDRLASDLLAPQVSDDERIRRLYLTAYGRSATPEELRQSLEFLDEITAGEGTASEPMTVRRHRAWVSLCQTVIAANEFVYVR